MEGLTQEARKIILEEARHMIEIRQLQTSMKDKSKGKCH